MRSPARRRLIAIISALLLAVAPVHAPGPAADAAAALGGPPEIETLGIRPLIGEFTVPGTPVDHVVIVWDEILDRSSVPSPGDFIATINGAGHAATGVSHLYAGVASDGFAFGSDGVSFMRIDLPVTIAIGDIVTLDYVPGPQPILDLSRTAAAGFSGVDVVLEDFGGFGALTAVLDSYHGADKVVIVLTDPIEPASLPAPSQFEVDVDGVPVAVSGVADLYPGLGLAFLEVTLAGAVTDPASIVEVAYASSPTTAISRLRGTSLDGFAGQLDAVVLADAVAGTLAPGESLSTVPAGGPTPEDPVGVSVTTSGSGAASIREGLVEGVPPRAMRSSATSSTSRYPTRLPRPIPT